MKTLLLSAALLTASIGMAQQSPTPAPLAPLPVTATAQPHYQGPLTAQEQAAVYAADNQSFIKLTPAQAWQLHQDAVAKVVAAHPSYVWHESTGPDDLSGLVKTDTVNRSPH